jgi:hypothetical protein
VLRLEEAVTVAIRELEPVPETAEVEAVEPVTAALELPEGVTVPEEPSRWPVI